MTFYYSTLKWTGIGTSMQQIGIMNSLRLLRDPMLWHSLKNYLILVIVSISVHLPLGLTLALLLNR